MASSTLANGCNNFLSPDGMHSPSARRRSTSVTPSEGSSRSRITVVENDPELASYHGPNDSSYEVTKIYAPKYTWLEHLFALFGINVAKRKEPIIRKEIITSKAPEVDEMDNDDSHWVLPVYVLSSRKDTDKQIVPKEAKCTIDTGNQQGNIVSREFVLNVLQFPEANFRSLTEKEKRGGTGYTGHTMVPEHAIYLTWYHKKSTRVFRDMRFLISPNQHCDLIIGAHSIREHKLLDVPNLMANSNTLLGKTAVKEGHQPEDKERKPLDNKWYAADQEVNNLQSRLDKETGAYAIEIKKRLAEAKEARDAAQKKLDDYDEQKRQLELHKLRKTPTGNKEEEEDHAAKTAQATGVDAQAKPKKRGLFPSRAR